MARSVKTQKDQSPRLAEPIRRRRRKLGAGSSTLADVAQLAGVSTASVSRVLNNGPAVSANLKKRIDAAIQTLGWIPNGAAKALASRRSHTIGALIPGLGHPNFGHIIQALQSKLALHGYTLLLGCTNNSMQSAMDQALKMVERGIECIVLIGFTQPPRLFPYLADRKIPSVITYTTGKPDTELAYETKVIGFDNKESISLVVRHLLELGHRNFGCISMVASKLNDRMNQRVEGVRDALACEGLAIRPQHLVELEEATISAGRAGVRQILDAKNWPTAIVCTNDYYAAGAIIEAKASGVAVPVQMSIAGFDDLELSSHLDPPITTVKVPDRAMGERVAEYILSLLDGDDPPKEAAFHAELVIRKSTGPAASHGCLSEIIVASSDQPLLRQPRR
jgi:LacI family transcriptional regulator